jgi:hypothetical protein
LFGFNQFEKEEPTRYGAFRFGGPFGNSAPPEPEPEKKEVTRDWRSEMEGDKDQ